MKLKEIEKIANKISKRYDMPEVIIEKGGSKYTYKYVEVRSELPTYSGGYALIAEIKEKLGYDGEYEGGCIYRFYKQ